MTGASRGEASDAGQWKFHDSQRGAKCAQRVDGGHRGGSRGVGDVGAGGREIGDAGERCGLEVLDGARYAAQDGGQGHGSVDGEGPGPMDGGGEVTTASQQLPLACL